MAAINNSINLTDRMSPVLKTVLKALDSTMKAMDQLDRATNKGMNSAAFKRAKADIDAANSAVSSLNGQLEKTGSLMDRVSQKAAKTAAAMYGAGVINREVSRQGGGKLLGIKGAAQIGAGKLLGGISQIPSVMKTFTGAVSSGFNTISDRCKLAYTETLSFINLVEKGIGAINGLMSANDAVTSDVAKIGLFNYDKNMSNAQAYGMAYRAAENSRSDLSDTTTLINRIMMSGVYGQEAGSLGFATRMAEILNKAMVVGGGTAEENKRALIQLSQGLSSGVLQGDELRSIREQAPYLASVLAEGLNKIDDRFIGTTVGDLKELGAQGELTSDVVIRALEAMQDQVDATFADKAPRTWAQGLTSIQNTIKVMTAYLQSMEGGPLSKISELVWIIADYLKSEDGIRLMSGIANMLTFIGNVLNIVIQAALNGITWLMDHSNVLIAILVVLASMAVIAGIQMAAAWVAATWPILLVIAAIALVIYILQQCGVSFSDIVGGIAGGVTWLVALIWNSVSAVIGFFKGLWAALGAIVDNIGILFYNLFKVYLPQLALEGAKMIVRRFSIVLDVLGKLVELLGGTGFSSKSILDKLDEKSSEIGDKAKEYKDVGQAYLDAYHSTGAFEDGWSSKAFNSGYEWGAGVVGTLTDGIGDFTGGLTDFMEGNTALYDSATGAGVNVAGGNLDSVGSIKNDVNINDEDIQLLRDMAARDYLLNLQQITPVAHISFGDVRETADVNKIMDVIEDMVEEQMATALVAN
jgi:tape measure domain-containing protein|nr:MAG TPA: Tail tape measure [Caudoviricetes sp.]